MEVRSARPRLLTGDRPTGRLHLGHYVGSLRNRVRLQGEYDCYFLVADYHALTTGPEDAARAAANTREVLLDWLSVGLDPEQSRFCLQSQVPQITELFTIFSMLVTVPRAERIPTLKERARPDREAAPSLGLLAYPVLQAADILSVRAQAVPVGKDQQPHVELAREIARRFNTLYAEIFPEPEALLAETPLLAGTDGGRKMSKSFGNTIDLADSPDVVRAKVIGMYTDPARIHATDPGRIEGNPVFAYLDAFDPDAAEVADLKELYRKGGVGDVAVKERLAEVLDRFLTPIRERRARFAARERDLRGMLLDGSAAARQEAERTMASVRAAIGW